MDVGYLQQLTFPAYAVTLDWLMNDQNLIADSYALQTAVIIALGTDARAPDTEELPDPDGTDRRGWWGDLDAELIWNGWPVGCLLWLLGRAKLTGPEAFQGSTLNRVDGWTRDAMKPFTQRLIATAIDVFPSQSSVRNDRIDVGVTIYRGPSPEVELRYSELWEELPRLAGPKEE